jgi:hypothetical protein
VHPLFFRASAAGPIRLVAGVLALLIALQGGAASLLATLGPLHAHKAPAQLVVLDDIRRGSSPASPAIRAAGRHGHVHGPGTAQRHHHAAGDTSVDLATGEAAQRLDADDVGFSTTLAGVVGLIPAALAWLPQTGRDVWSARLAWVPQTHHPEPFERPPRLA